VGVWVIIDARTAAFHQKSVREESGIWKENKKGFGMPSIYSINQSNSTSFIEKNYRSQDKALGQVASGKKINKASDNAAGLAVAMQMLSDVSSLRQASTNVLQGTSVLQTADGALQQAGNILDRMKSLATQANSGSLDNASRNAINEEYQSLRGELDGLRSSTTFNGAKLLDGSYNQNFQAGSSAGDTLNADLSSVDLSSGALGLTPGAGANAGALSTQASAAATSAELDTAIGNLSSFRAQTGAMMSSFSTRGDVIETETNSILEAQSAIMDVDFAQAQMDLQNSKVLTDSSIAAAAQGNRMKSSLLSLLR
jgi:flagellin